MKILITILLFSTSVFADYSSELTAIEKFEKDVFNNKNNYLPAKKGQLPDLTPAFKNKLKTDEKSLKYFYVISTSYRAFRMYKTDVHFQAYIKKQFGGKEPTKSQWERVFAVLANNVLKEPVSVLTKCLNDNSYSDEHFDKQIEILLRSKI